MNAVITVGKVHTLKGQQAFGSDKHVFASYACRLLQAVLFPMKVGTYTVLVNYYIDCCVAESH
jgi:hypothetical protein